MHTVYMRNRWLQDVTTHPSIITEGCHTSVAGDGLILSNMPFEDKRRGLVFFRSKQLPNPIPTTLATPYIHFLVSHRGYLGPPGPSMECWWWQQTAMNE